jgi:hypothetical protein
MRTDMKVIGDRMNRLFGAIAVLMVVVSIFGPKISQWLFGAVPVVGK